MFIDLTAEQRRLRDELRGYFAGCLTAEQRAEIAADPFGPAYMAHCRRLGADGMLGVAWPKEYGGRGYGPIEQQIFANEIARAEVPYPLITLNSVAPTILQYGSPEQKEFFLPRILRGECHFAIGYSEPGAGTDLAALRTTAVRDGDHYVVNGQKVFTSGAQHADYVWLAARTDPRARRHKGISVLIVDCRDPGFSWTPIITMDGLHHTNATYYQDVKVPAGMLVGEENKGWDLIVNQLNHERVTLGPAGNLGHLYDKFAHWARTAVTADGRPLVELPEVRRALARVRAYLRVNEFLNWQVAAGLDLGWLGAPDASATKIYASERMLEVGRIVGDVLARHGDPGDPATRTFVERLDRTAKGSLVLTFGGGVNEIQRELIAMIGLGLPRAPR
ncbi:acyl-CoA dehydrogenase family protein [Thermomonospora cellulosilytica]|uniref:Alkylation response protein AidB-like acyl-CoA dehydrogenase n=1 Tax=Thermomonospora cellulosilytica TaxID=1411118 RepID=A0A7W3N4N4_9ACTN|nr:acyl-CoA dehydrogenase family protein [Thermomonospora cellulosilytica]MBA9007402.1 alkylation response protein AidB-like acyl-CoA dehydrogenase [Thermomonospora cellulosilytica]